MKSKSALISLLTFVFFMQMQASSFKEYDLSRLGIKPDTGQDISMDLQRIINYISAHNKGDTSRKIRLKFAAGRYDFYPDNALAREYYISNHDQHNPKRVGIPFEHLSDIELDGQGSQFVFHGRMLPLALVGCKHAVLKNFSIDFQTPHIAQVQVIKNDVHNGGISFKPSSEVNYTIIDSTFCHKGEGWQVTPRSGIAFEEQTKHLVYNTSDLSVMMKPVFESSPGVIESPRWKNPKLLPGTVVALRSWERPAPAIFVSECKDISFQNVQIHYTEGMGLLAQMTEDISLDRFSVCLRSGDNSRYFTTQADATHFSGCKGTITSSNGLYEGMMDDAINVHGTYLKVEQRLDDHTLLARYMHSQTWGFRWGDAGDSVQFVSSKTMEVAGKLNRIQSIAPYDRPQVHGAKVFKISFEKALDTEIGAAGSSWGIENLEWTPQVVFSGNVVRNNRARGTLFSTPRKVVVENNLFDHTSGTAILLCGDCNGWYETGACTDVTIRNNRFVNSLTNQFQFTNAIISIYPEIPDLKNQTKYFHRGIVIENNQFETFDAPIVYAKSVDGLIFRNNSIRYNNDYPPFHWNKHPFFFERVINYHIHGNDTPHGYDVKLDLKSVD